MRLIRESYEIKSAAELTEEICQAGFSIDEKTVLFALGRVQRKALRIKTGCVPLKIDGCKGVLVKIVLGWVAVARYKGVDFRLVDQAGQGNQDFA